MAQLAEGFGDPGQGPRCIQAAGVGENPNLSGAQVLWLGADGGAGAAEGSAVGGDAGHGEDAGAAVGDQGGEALASGTEFGRVELGGLGGGAGDQVGDAQPVAGQQVLLGRGQEARGEAGQVQGGPEPVARPGEVPACTRPQNSTRSGAPGGGSTSGMVRFAAAARSAGLGRRARTGAASGRVTPGRGALGG